MEQYKLMNRYNGEVLHVASITCSHNTPRSFKLRKALEWVIQNGKDTTNLDLSGGDFENFNFDSVDMQGCMFDDANLFKANINNTNFKDCSFHNTRIEGVHGLNDYVKSLFLENWAIAYTSEVLQIGRRRHTIEEWDSFTFEELHGMGARVLPYIMKYEAVMKTILENFPAKPMSDA